MQLYTVRPAAAVQATPMPAVGQQGQQNDCNELRIVEASGRNRSFAIALSSDNNGSATDSRISNGSDRVFIGADFDFGDGKKQSKVAATAPTAVTVSHAYSKDGVYTASATVHFAVKGKPTARQTCNVTVAISTPYYQCVRLQGPAPQERTYTFLATAEYGGGAQLISGDFDFGDGKKQTQVVPIDAQTITATHTYDDSKMHSVGATLYFNVDGAVVRAPVCRAVAAPHNAPVPECRTGVAVGDENCSPCVYDVTVRAGDKKTCIAPVAAVQTKTGHKGMVALVIAGLLGLLMTYKHIVFKRQRYQILD